MKLPKLFTKDSVVIAGHHVPLALIAIVVAVVGIILVKRAGSGLSLGTAPTMPDPTASGADVSGALDALSGMDTAQQQLQQVTAGVPDPLSAVSVSPSPVYYSSPSGALAPSAQAFAMPAAGTTAFATLQPAAAQTFDSPNFNPILPRSSGAQAIGDVAGLGSVGTAGSSLIAGINKLIAAQPSPPPAPRAIAGPALIAGINQLAQQPSGVLRLSGRAGGNVGLL